jgi:hypothetical protein
LKRHKPGYPGESDRTLINKINEAGMLMDSQLLTKHNKKGRSKAAISKASSFLFNDHFGLPGYFSAIILQVVNEPFSI